ncbi:MAG: peptide ABC transporter substrate-binding protein [Armatimonadota bacterium]|nr:peptide ABC transporter substrate-binding protein [Armatimonadota bacterium]MDR7485478.1 peptide ABC transporter substrate-binding protein [Armatimonadota bacterium]MDR7533023.1 peptide ABC transporter substrate-binding protein [Armatimonadota bacterium]MDR7536805.1 peptide ABC transporter substrate-binding protein [Armatimonadota bacterium]
MAERWEVSRDGLTWTFFLRAARWSNGQPVTAADFEYAWKRVLDPKLASEYAYQLYYIKNGKAYNTGKIADPAQVGVKARDARTLVVTLESPTPFFGDLLSFHTLMPVPRAVVAATPTWASRADTFVGNGPFVLKEWTRQNRIVVEKNPRYWDAARIKLQRIEFAMIEAESTALAQYEAGQLDGSSNVPVADIPRPQKTGDFKAMPYIGTYYYLFNTTRKPLDDVRVRKALAYAINRTLITARITRAGEKPATAFVPPGIVVAGTDFRQAGGALAPVYDPATARKLLAEAGFPAGRGFPTLTILYNTSQRHKTIAEAIQEMWRQTLGIQVNLTNQEWKVYLQSRQQSNFDIARAGWIGDYRDPKTFLDMFFTGSSFNEGRWSNPAYDRLIEATTKTADQAARMKAFHEAERIPMQEMPLAPISCGGPTGWRSYAT